MTGPEAASTVFVGSISPGVPDRWLHQLLEACGGFRNLKRVSKAFGFADFQSAPDVLRVRSVLNGVELPSMGAEYGAPPKKLVVKADEKTNIFLGEFEKTLVQTDVDRQKEREARRRVDHLVGVMRKRASDKGEVDVSVYEIPAHLKDLPQEELHGPKREHVLSEIEKFRLSAVARDAAERKRVLELERRRALLAQERTHRHAEPTPEPTEETDPEGADEAAEQRRKRAVAERREREGRDAEAAYNEKEHARIQYWTQHMPRDRPPPPLDGLREDRELASELFWTDRRRWLAERAPHRRREQDADQADREAQAAEEEKARQDAEAFLEEQAREMAALAEKQRQSGLLMHDGQPLKLQVHRAKEDEARRKRLALVHHLGPHPSRDAVEKVLPTDPSDLFAVPPDWQHIQAETYQPLLDAGIEDSLGEAVDDLRDAALEKLREHAPAHEIIEVLEPVLEDDAHALVVRLWRAMLVDALTALSEQPPSDAAARLGMLSSAVPVMAELKAANRGAYAALAERRGDVRAAQRRVDDAAIALEELVYERKQLEAQIAACAHLDTVYEQVPLRPQEESGVEGDDPHHVMLARLQDELEARRKLEQQAKALEDEAQTYQREQRASMRTLRTKQKQISSLVEAAKK
ncbi:uncharacterized protein MJAP1_001812 [Malassezia japonica]|uniref:RRM domain-containing protein n=1 Tax=Malassezia japonica TaxID=223818 RepID=A0AAF0J9V1_9BASI|nr:uncharacterized protein MJAP1_001812 [Malassezia japonica]WFD38848.1 hypothetical protein MJAP1_001812 [Malassezia japonica]